MKKQTGIRIMSNHVPLSSPYLPLIFALSSFEVVSLFLRPVVVLSYGL
jgi:hypothetical protein